MSSAFRHYPWLRSPKQVDVALKVAKPHFSQCLLFVPGSPLQCSASLCSKGITYTCTVVMQKPQMCTCEEVVTMAATPTKTCVFGHVRWRAPPSVPEWITKTQAVAGSTVQTQTVETSSTWQVLPISASSAAMVGVKNLHARPM